MMQLQVTLSHKHHADLHIVETLAQSDSEIQKESKSLVQTSNCIEARLTFAQTKREIRREKNEDEVRLICNINKYI